MEKLAEGFGLIEGPVWDSTRGLIFSDVLNGGVFCLDETGAVTTLFAHRRGVGGIVPHVAGGLVVSGRNISFKPFDGGATRLLLDRDEPGGNVGYNDITTDRAGRIYAGSLGSSPVFDDGRGPAAGDLYLIDTDGRTRVVGNDILLTNGLGFSPDGTTLYHSDSGRRAVCCYAVQANGDLGRKETLAEVPEGVPDGLAVSVDGRIWVALAGGGHGVAVFGADGTLLQRLDIPQPMCTSLCFGGADLQDLYVVSGSEGSGGDNAGAIYRTRVDVAGLPLTPARVVIPAAS